VCASDFPEKNVSYAAVIAFFCCAVSPLESAAPAPASGDRPPASVAGAVVLSPPAPESPEEPQPETASPTAAHSASATPAERARAEHADVLFLRVRKLIMVRLSGGT